MDKTFAADEAEPRIYAAWERAGAFRAGANARPGAETFCIMIPPPNVTGVLHMGHAFNNTLQDILVRWHRMRGFDTLWQPGQDHAGIATQMVVERMLAETGQPSRREMGREAFTAKVWEWKEESGGTIVEQLRRLGASCDWSRNAFTMSGAPDAPAGEEGNFHDAVIRAFVKMHEDGLIYRGKRLVNWDPHFETAISDLEVENIETEGHMWHFKYPLAGGATYEYVERDGDGSVTLRETRDYISIATTRPETMLGDGAVAVHPSDGRYAPIVGKLCEIPVGPGEHRRLIPIITDTYPDPEFGSGAVKITGAHDFNDHVVARRGGIPMYRLMDARGHMRSDGAPYAEAAAVAGAVAEGRRSLTEAGADAINLVPDDLRGLDRFEARRRVVAQVTAEGLAVMTVARDPRLGSPPAAEGESGDSPVPLVEARKIVQPFGDRSKVVIEPMLTDQWFVDTARIVGPALQAVRDGTTEILPEQHRKVYFNWLAGIEPWCISRQLWWGHRIPVWYGPKVRDGTPCADELETFCAADEASAVALAETFYRAGARVVADSAEFAEAVSGCAAKAASGKGWKAPLYRDPDVLDTWFSSGLWPIGTLGWPERTPELDRYFPTSVLVTGFDIIFFWVARMMMMQYAMVGDRPFDTVYVHALVRDAAGNKMSKSLGNVIDPIEMVDRFGADAVRFTLASMAAMGRDLRLSEGRVAGSRNFTTKLWNAARFAEMNGAFDVAAGERAPRAGQTVNRWIVGELAKVRIAVDEALDGFRFNDAANALHAFVRGTFCDWYVEFSKPLFKTAHAGETRRTMAWVLDQVLILLHPFMPFVTEEIWAASAPARERMLVHADWPACGGELVDAAAEREIGWVIDLIEKVRSVRGEMNVPPGARIPLLKLSLDAAGEAAWANNESLIMRQARIETLTDADAPPRGSATIAALGGTFALPLGGLIDVAAERVRLERAVGKLERVLAGLKGRLDSGKFRENAAEDVVAGTEKAAALKAEELGRLRTALGRLDGFG